MGDARDGQVRDEPAVDETSMLHAGTTGAEARDMARGDGTESGTPQTHGSREEVIERAMGEQREIEAAHGATPDEDPSQRAGFNRILHVWTLVGALIGAGIGALAGWLAVHYRGSQPELIIALAAVGVVVGAVVVGASRVAREDGRVQKVVEEKVPTAGTPGDEDLEAAPEQPEEQRTPAGTRTGG
jgi:F0F1-type ATP synthase assembly protein I